MPDSTTWWRGFGAISSTSLGSFDRRVPAVVGRHARLDLVFECRGGRTVITHGYAEPPLRIGRSFDVNGAAFVILVCTGPGVFAGDSLHQRVSVGRGARVLIASQSALQVHPGGAPAPATLCGEYVVEAGGELHCHWDPVIPFAGARLVQRFDVRAGGTSRVYWSDGLMSGRVGRGETWQFDVVDHELRFTCEEAVQYLERFCLAPRERDPRRPWIMAEANYLGTTLVHHDAATPASAGALQRQLDRFEGVRAGVDVVQSSVLAVRLLGTSGPAWAAARARCREALLGAVFGSPELVVRR